MKSTATLNETSDPLPLRWKWNTLFRGDQERASYNACVGNNGAPDIYYYADGFADSVNLLIDGLTTGRGILDTLIYPICFSLRHSVELTIKGQIQDLSYLAKLCKRPIAPDADVEKVLNQHDIQNLWDYFSTHAIATDRRYLGLISASGTLIRCIAETDPTGQTFRYSYSTEAKKHLTDVSLINVLVLRDQFRIIRDNLENLRAMTDWLWQEYSTGSFTKNLNREDLVAITRQLPPRQSWADADTKFGEIKSSIKSKYSIGSAELSEAFKKIEVIRDMARAIGVSVNIPGLTIDDLNALNDCWNLAWDRKTLKSQLSDDIYGRDFRQLNLADLIHESQCEILGKKDFPASQNSFRQWATEEKLAGLQALLEGGRCVYSEEYDWRFENYKTEMAVVFSASAEELNEEIDDIWARTVGRQSYPSRIIDALNRTGFKDEARRLMEIIDA